MSGYRCPNCGHFAVVAQTIGMPERIVFVCEDCHGQFEQDAMQLPLDEKKVQQFPGNENEPRSNLSDFLKRKRS